MGAPPSLPFFAPQQVQAIPGARAGPVGPIEGTLPYRMPAIAGIAQGLSDFVDSYHSHRQAREAYYQDKFWNAVKARQMGLGGSLNDQEIMRWAELGGLPIKKQNVGELQYQKQMQAYAQEQSKYLDYQKAQADIARTNAQARDQAAAAVAARGAAAQAPVGTPGGNPMAAIWGGATPGQPWLAPPGPGITGPGAPGPGNPEANANPMAALWGGATPANVSLRAPGPAAGVAGTPGSNPLAALLGGGATPGVGPQMPPGGPGMQPPVAPAPYQPGAQPGFFGRMFGRGEPKAYDTGWLQNLTEASKGGTLPEQVGRNNVLSILDFEAKKLGYDVNKMNAQQQLQIGEYIKQGLANPNSDVWTMLRRLNVANLSPTDEAMLLADTVGYPRQAVGKAILYNDMGGMQWSKMMLEYRQGMFKEFLPRFGGNANLTTQFVNDMIQYGSSKLMPGYTPEEGSKVAEMNKQNAELMSGAPPDVVDMFTKLQLANVSPEIQSAFLASARRSFPAGPYGDPSRVGTWDYRLRQTGLNIEAANSATNRWGTEATAYNTAWGRYNEGYEAVQRSGGADYDRWYKIWSNPKSTDQEKQDALKGMTIAENKMTNVPFNFGGRPYTVNDGVEFKRGPQVSWGQALPFGSGYSWQQARIGDPTMQPRGGAGAPQFWGAPGGGGYGGGQQQPQQPQFGSEFRTPQDEMAMIRAQLHGFTQQSKRDIIRQDYGSRFGNLQDDETVDRLIQQIEGGPPSQSSRTQPWDKTWGQPPPPMPTAPATTMSPLGGAQPQGGAPGLTPPAGGRRQPQLQQPAPGYQFPFQAPSIQIFYPGYGGGGGYGGYGYPQPQPQQPRGPTFEPPPPDPRKQLMQYMPDMPEMQPPGQ